MTTSTFAELYGSDDVCDKMYYFKKFSISVKNLVKKNYLTSSSSVDEIVGLNFSLKTSDMILDVLLYVQCFASVLSLLELVIH